MKTYVKIGLLAIGIATGLYLRHTGELKAQEQAQTQKPYILYSNGIEKHLNQAEYEQILRGVKW